MYIVCYVVCMPPIMFQAFLWDQNVVRVPPDILLTQGEVTLTEGIQSSKFFLLIVEQLQYMLSPEIDASLVWRLKNFADFNRDDKVSILHDYFDQ